MIGTVDQDGTPYIVLRIANKDWMTVIDTGFNNDFELPTALFDEVVIDCIGPGIVHLAGGRSADEEFYRVRVPFDGQIVVAEATFVESKTLLIGTRMLNQYQLTIHFPERTVTLERAT